MEAPNKYLIIIDECVNKIALNDNDVNAYFQRALANSCIGNYDSSIEDYIKVIELNPNNSNAYFNRGLNFCKKKMFREAIQDFTKAIALNPKYEKAFCFRGKARLNINDIQGSIQDCNNAIELNSKYGDAYYTRGLAYEIYSNGLKAIEDYSKAIELNPNNPNAYCYRGRTYNNISYSSNPTQYTERAITDLKKVFDLSRSNVLNSNITSYLLIAIEELGIAEYRMKRFQEVMENFEFYIKHKLVTNPKYVRVYFLSFLKINNVDLEMEYEESDSLEMYKVLEEKYGFEKIINLKSTVDEYEERRRLIVGRGKLIIYKKNYRLGFGKYKGLTIEQILPSDPSYITWCITHVIHFAVSPDVFAEDYFYKNKIAFLKVFEVNFLKRLIISKANSERARDEEDNDYDFSNWQ